MLPALIEPSITNNWSINFSAAASPRPFPIPASRRGIHHVLARQKRACGPKQLFPSSKEFFLSFSWESVSTSFSFPESAAVKPPSSLVFNLGFDFFQICHRITIKWGHFTFHSVVGVMSVLSDESSARLQPQAQVLALPCPTAL